MPKACPVLLGKLYLLALLPGMILQTGWKWKSAYKIITIRRKVGM